jgi:hypothetical protein
MSAHILKELHHNETTVIIKTASSSAVTYFKKSSIDVICLDPQKMNLSIIMGAYKITYDLPFNVDVKHLEKSMNACFGFGSKITVIEDLYKSQGVKNSIYDSKMGQTDSTPI